MSTSRVEVERDLHLALSGKNDGYGFGDGIRFYGQLVIGRTAVHEESLIRSRGCQIKTSSGQWEIVVSRPIIPQKAWRVQR